MMTEFAEFWVYILFSKNFLSSLIVKLCLKQENLNQSEHISGLIYSETELMVASF